MPPFLPSAQVPAGPGGQVGGRRALWNCWQHAAAPRCLGPLHPELPGVFHSRPVQALQQPQTSRAGLHATRGSAVTAVCRRGDAAWAATGSPSPGSSALASSRAGWFSAVCRQRARSGVQPRGSAGARMVSHPNFCLMREGAFRSDGASPAGPAAAGCVALRRRPLGTRLSHAAVVVRWARFARCMFQDLLGAGRGTERRRPHIFGAV